MNKQAMYTIRKQAQSGFTLIELIVVIVILGILAATALPRFANLGGDARLASMNAVRGALTSTAATAHGQWLINPTLANVQFEGTPITFTTPIVSGYPQANANFAIAAGITNADYTVYPAGTTGTTTVPAAAAGSISIVPNSIVNTTRAVSCFVNYAEPAAANGTPVVTLTATAAGC
ncbi:type II secretion system protein [Duganella hordei]|uniref:type II secretion system protein n=1 Tax=Duganella hordei TaxID=2865934 RepID=UPI0030EA6E25